MKSESLGGVSFHLSVVMETVSILARAIGINEMQMCIRKSIT